MEFRLLRADEIDVRIAQVSQNGVKLLLYKDARCDQNILDETVGPLNWQRHHCRENANCIVSIWDAEKQMWVEKEDTGTESYTEREKGLASDSFKRACFNWGIGRELYTAPDMKVYPKQLKKFKEEGGRYTCRDRFCVADIEYDGRKIVRVDITIESTGETVSYGTTAKATREIEQAKSQTIDRVKADALQKLCERKGVKVEQVYERYHVEELADLTEGQHYGLQNWLLGLPDGNDRKD